jgi:hypothetical protein
VGTFVGCFALWQIAGSFLVDSLPVEARFPELREVLQRADQRPEADIVLFGTSRLKGLPAEWLERALSGRSFGGVLNASVPAGDPFTYDRILTALREQQPHTRLAIIEVNPEMLTPHYRFLRVSVARFFTWPDMVRWRGALVSSRSMNEAIGSRFAPFYKYRHALWAWMAASPVAELPAARLPIPELEALATPLETAADQAENTRRALNTAVAYEGWMEDYEISGPIPESLERFLERCRAQQIDAIVLAAPATTAVRRIYTPPREERFQTFIHGVSERLGVPFVDYRARLEDRFFNDGVHLTPAGGARLTELLATEVIAPRRAAQ